MNKQKQPPIAEPVKLPELTLELLNQHMPAAEFESLDDKAYCLHCDKKINLRKIIVHAEPMPIAFKVEGSKKVHRGVMDMPGDVWLECPTPGCDGSPLDWSCRPWWR
jgi:hypothetical protein